MRLSIVDRCLLWCRLPKAFHPVINLIPVKPPLGSDLGTGQLAFLGHLVELAAAHLQIAGKLLDGQPFVLWFHVSHRFSEFYNKT